MAKNEFTRQMNIRNLSSAALSRLLTALSVVAALTFALVTSGPSLKAGVTAGSAVGVRAAPFNMYGANNDFGMVNQSVESLSGQTAHQRMREYGLGWVRYWLSWEAVEGSDGVYDWSRPDFDINAAIAQGLSVYVTIQGGPAWPHGGKLTYHWGQCSLNGTGEYDSTRPDCGPAGSANAYAPFDPGGGLGQSYYWRRFVTTAVKRYSDRVKYWGFWNEPQSKWFFPEWEEAPCYNRGVQLLSKIIKPGREAALAANPNVVIVGPDENLVVPDGSGGYFAGVLDALLSMEQNGVPSCGVPPYGRLFDVVSFHAYSWGPGIVNALNGLKRALDNHDRREVWITETNGDGPLIDALTEFGGRGWISKVFAYRMRGTCGILALLDSNLNPCGSLLTFQSFIQSHPPAMHFAGATGVPGHYDFLLLQNPHNVAANALVTFANASGSSLTQTYSLPATSRATVYVPGSGAPFAAQDQGITVAPQNPSLAIWAEHADYWNSQEAGRGTEGAYERSDTWYFAEGQIGGGFWVENLTAYNPNPGASVTVTWTFLNASGTTTAFTSTLPPRGQYKLLVSNVPGVENSHSTIVSGVWFDGAYSGHPAPIAADRTMSWGSDIEGHASKGVAFPSTTWYFAEGNDGGGWSTYLLLMNPTYRTANIQVYYMLPGGLSAPNPYSINPRSRFTINPTLGSSFGIIVRSVGADAVPIVAERAVYYGAGWTVGTIGQGATSPMQRWMFAEGSTEGYNPYYLLANPSSVGANINVSFQIQGGSPFNLTLTLGAGQRYTIDPWVYPQLQNKSFAAEITVSSATTPGEPPPGIIAERAMYWSGPSGGFIGGHVSLGMP